MKSIFIDCGGYKGDGIKFAKEYYPNHDIHTFEANRALWKYLKNTNLHKEAVWDKDGEIDFYIAGEDAGSTAVQGKLTAHIDYDNPVKVKAIDLSQWIKKNFDKDDHIVLKLNVEGAEYPILYKMIADGTLSMVDILYVSFHSKKITKYTSNDDERIKEEIKKAGVQEEYWY